MSLAFFASFRCSKVRQSESTASSFLRRIQQKKIVSPDARLRVHVCEFTTSGTRYIKSLLPIFTPCGSVSVAPLTRRFAPGFIALTASSGTVFHNIGMQNLKDWARLAVLTCCCCSNIPLALVMPAYRLSPASAAVIPSFSCNSL